MTTFMSCVGASKQPVNAEDFGVFEQELQDVFGDDAFYTRLSIGFDHVIGSSINAIVTEKPESLKMGEWNMTKGSWKQHSEITLEVSEGSKASDFMFQLNDEFSLKKLGELVEKSIVQLKVEKKIKNPVLSMAYINFPDNGDVSKADYNIKLEPENGGTAFNFSYKLGGELIEMSY